MASMFVAIGVALIDVLAFILAIVAEQRRSKATIETDQNNGILYCSYDADVSTSYGIVALVFLLLSQTIIMVFSRCFCCGRALAAVKHRTWSGICFVACWITFAIAEICLLAASVRNAHHTKYFFQDNTTISCNTLRKGVFAAGASFILFTTILSELYYVLYSKARNNSLSSQQPSIIMTPF